MAYELEFRSFEKARKVLSHFHHELATESMLNGLTPGRMLVDCPDSPESAFAWYKGKAWLSGDPENEAFIAALPKALSKTYYTTLSNLGYQAFRLGYEPRWENRLPQILEGLSRAEGRRSYFHLDASEHVWNLDILDGYHIRRIDQSLLTEGDLRNLDMVKEELGSERQSAEDFLEKSFGYCTINADTIASWCTSEYNTGNRCELGIYTIESHRRLGLATLTARAVIRHALTQGIDQIGWHCWADNQASVATALKIGFKHKHQYKVQTIQIG